MIFTQLEGVLNSAESVTFKVDKMADGRLAVLIQPVIRPMDTGSDEVQQIRAALAMPLRFVEQAAVLDGGLIDKLVSWNAQRSELASQDCFARFGELASSAKGAAKKAEVAKPKDVVAKSISSSVAAPSGASEPAQAQANAQPATNPDCLF